MLKWSVPVTFHRKPAPLRFAGKSQICPTFLLPPNVDVTVFTCATIGTIQSWGGTSSSDRQHWRLLYSCHLEGKIFQIAGFWGFSKGFNCLILVFPRLCDHCSIASFHETETKTKSAKQIFLSHMLLFLLDPESLWLRK